MLWREPNWLWLLFAVLVIALVVASSLRRRAALLTAFADSALLGRLAPDVNPTRRAVKATLRVGVLALLAVALAGPKWGFHWETMRREGIDLMIAVDTSRSMLATDVKPNRLERAKLAVLDLVKLLQGDRVGLVAFAGSAFLECPLTLDYSAFEQSLRSVQVGLIPRGGTSLAQAIDTSLDGFDAREGKHQALILITDGEDHEGTIEQSAKRAAEQGVKIYTVGIGTQEGDLIPAGPGPGSFVKDRKGQVVKSRLQEDTLQQIAVTSGGAYVRGLGAALGLDEVFRDHIAKMEKRDVASTLERRYEDRFQVPLAGAFALLVLESLVGERRPMRAPRRWRLWGRRGRGAAPATTARALSVLLLAVLPALVGWFDPPGDRAAEGNHLYRAGKYADAAEKYGEGLVDAPGSPLLQFNLGTARYKEGKYADAAAALEKVAAGGDRRWVAPAAYNLGNAQFRIANEAESSDPKAAIAGYERALESFKRAMAADPNDPDPKFNHEFVARKLTDLKKRLEEEAKKQREQEEQQQPEQADQPSQDQQQAEQPQEGNQDRTEPGDQQATEEARQDAQPPAQQPEDPQAGGGQPNEPQTGDAGAPQPAAGEGEPVAGREQDDNPDRQAAQAVIDTARGEELDAGDVKRRLPVAGVAEPAEDW